MADVETTEVSTAPSTPPKAWHDILRGALSASELTQELSAVWESLAKSEAVRVPVTRSDLEAWTVTGALPPSVFPLGELQGQPIALDVSYTALTRGVLPVVRREGEHFWGVLSERASAWTGSLELATAAPTAFRTFADQARERSDAQTRSSALAEALLRPLYTARSMDEVEWVQAELIRLDAEQTAAPHPLRLAVAGLDGEAWRIVGAERGIAGRMREAIVAFEGALLLGCNRELAFRALKRVFSNMGWGHCSRLLKLYSKVSGG